MPKTEIVSKPHAEILTFEEILRLMNIFASFGVKKIRLTGGEPLVRRGIVGLIRSVSEIEGVEQLCMTTNGILLHYYADALLAAGLKNINISLDTLNNKKFIKITRRNLLDDVLRGIESVRNAGFPSVKLNVVVMKGINDAEIPDFVEFASSKGITLRFIEFMKITPLWDEANYMPLEDIKDICEKRFGLHKIGTIGSSPSVYYKTDSDAMVGFIKTDKNICNCCNRLRLTASGEMKICLYEEHGLNLKALIRNGIGDNELKRILAAKLGTKESVDYRSYSHEGSYMYTLGG